MSQSTSQVIVEHSPYVLLPHPLNRAVYGQEKSDPDLEKSIGENGFLTPVDVTRATHGGQEGLYILSGHRRVLAAIELKIFVPVRVLDNQGDVWQEAYLLEANRQRVKTPVQIAREYQELVRIEKILGDARRAAGVRETTSASQRAATAVGATAPWARKMNFILEQADQGNPIAIEGLAQINAGTAAPESIFRAVSPREVDDVSAHYDEVARRLQERAGLFEVIYSPRSQEPQNGFLFKHRFACEEECDAFLDMLKEIPEEARNTFSRISASWQKANPQQGAV